MTTRQPFWKWRRWKTKCFLSHSHKHTKFETEIPKQTWVMLQKPCHLQSIQMKNPIWLPGSHFENDCHWKSIGFYPYTQVFCYWSLEWIFKAKLKLESGNQKIQYGHQVVILKLTLPMATINMHMKFEIPKQTPKTMLSTDRQTRWIQYTYPHPTSLGGSIMRKILVRFALTNDIP